MMRSRRRKPDVSVVMPMWNAERFVAEAIDSVLAQQTRASWELIIVDDGSTDTSRAIAREYERDDRSRIHLLCHPGGANRGSSASRNLAIECASAEYLALLDADDVWLPHRLEQHLPTLRATSEAAMIYGQAERWFDFSLPFPTPPDHHSRNYLPPLIPLRARPGLLQPPVLLDWFLADESMTPCTCTVLLRTEAVRSIGGFENSFTDLYDDQVFYAKLALEYPLIVDLECVARYRKHSDSCCAKASRCFVDESEAEASRVVFLDWLAEYQAQRYNSHETRHSCPLPLAIGTRRDRAKP